MMGFYLILDLQLSLADLAARVGMKSASALYFHPHVMPGEPNELHVQGDTSSDTVLIQVAAYVEEEVQKQMSQYFGTTRVKIFQLTYGDRNFLKQIAPLILNENRLWVFDDEGLASGPDFLRRLLS
jgi:hypothetical protein